MDRNDEAERLLELALERPAAERQAFLAEACAEARDLYHELVAMLPWADADQDFLRSPILRPAIPDLVGFLEAQAEGGRAAGSLPERIGGYRIVRLLGHGGMGLVYEAHQSDPERSVALKVLFPWPATSELVGRFAAEAEVLARLQSPGIPRIFEVGVEDFTDSTGAVHRLPFMAMERVEGEPLSRYAARSDNSPRSLLRVFAKICEAVEHAHGQGVIHRDLKPANVLVEAGGQPRFWTSASPASSPPGARPLPTGRSTAKY